MTNINAIKATIHIFTSALIVSHILNFKMFDVKNVGQIHGVKYSKWSHSEANIDLYKSHIGEFFASSHHFQDIRISNFVTLKM